MKKRVLLLMVAVLTVFSVSGCTVNVTETEVETEKATEKKTEKETEKETEKVTEEKETETETEITLSQAYLEGTVTDWSDDEITIDADDGNSYDIDISDATWELDDYGLYDGIYVGCNLKSATSKNGVFIATDLDEQDDPAEDQQQTTASTSSQSETSAQTQAQTSAPSASSGVASSTDLTGYVYGADGSTLTLECDDGNEYSIYYADASVEETDDGLVDGSYCAITIATVDVSADGNWTALDVEQLDDPDEAP